MKKVIAYSIVDRLSESVLATFYCPTMAMAAVTFENYLKDIVKKTGDDSIRDQFFCVQCDGTVNVPETYEEAVECSIVLDGVREIHDALDEV